MAKKNKMEKEIVNQFVICGELLDFTNVKAGTSKTGKEYFKYTMKVETDKATGEAHDVEFFEMKESFDGSENGRYKAMCTAYEKYKTRVEDKVGDIVRLNGRLTTNSYVSQGEIVNKLILSGSYMTHKDENNDKEEGYFDSCAIFNGVAFIDKIEELEDKVVVSALINEYKSKNKGSKGHLVDLIATEKDIIEGVKAMFKEEMVLPVGAKLVDMVEVVFLDEEKTKELEKKEMVGFGTGLEDIKKHNQWVEKENERRKVLREEGLKVHREVLSITGCTAPLSIEEIEEKELPFEKFDIDEMFDGVYKIQDDLANELKLQKVSDADVPF